MRLLSNFRKLSLHTSTKHMWLSLFGSGHLVCKVVPHPTVFAARFVSHRNRQCISGKLLSIGSLNGGECTRL